MTGDPMINAGILDGDAVIIMEADTANTGEIIVALVDDEEATVKRACAAAAIPDRPGSGQSGL